MNTAIVGGGSFGTSLANILAEEKEVLLYSIEADVVKSVNAQQRNIKYFPNNVLSGNIKATSQIKDLSDSDVILLAIPSHAVVDFVCENRKHFKAAAVLLNMAKGFGKDNLTIYESCKPVVRQALCALKGPTFAAELVNKSPSAMTLGAEDDSHFRLVGELFQGTCIKLDFTHDVIGVEILSILKNIYAIIIGIVDAYYNSANVRFMVLTRALNEMRSILGYYNACEDTLFRYCGIGDLGLTALNDLSRNRTLGLLIGKGFFNSSISGGVVLEGIRALNIFYDKLQNTRGPEPVNCVMLKSLSRFFKSELDINRLMVEFVHEPKNGC